MSNLVTRWKAIAKDAIASAKAKEGHAVPLSLVLAVIETESSGKPDAVSKSGARGLMQLMPATAKWLGVIDSFDPKQNIFGGTLYLAKLIKMFGRDWTLVSAAYNAGQGTVKRAGGVPQIPETVRYVQKIKTAMEKYKDQR